LYVVENFTVSAATHVILANCETIRSIVEKYDRKYMVVTDGVYRYFLPEINVLFICREG